MRLKIAILGAPGCAHRPLFEAASSSHDLRRHEVHLIDKWWIFHNNNELKYIIFSRDSSCYMNTITLIWIYQDAWLQNVLQHNLILLFYKTKIKLKKLGTSSNMMARILISETIYIKSASKFEYFNYIWRCFLGWYSRNSF